MIKAIGYAAKSSFSSLKPLSIERRNPGPHDVVVEILYCGICHSDIHQAQNEWKNTIYPCVPGHEITGRVVQVGSKVKKFKTGDAVAIGPMIDSCSECQSCQEGLEQYCEKGYLGAYNGNARYPSESNLTFGGFSNMIVVQQDFVFAIPKNIDLAEAAPLMCAGITTYSPLRYWNVGKGTKVGIVGLGGLGHMAIKLALAMGAEVTLITHSPEKKAHAKKLGVKKVIVSTDKKSMEKNANTLDFILSTIPESHDANPYIGLLKRDGVITVVGCIAPLAKATDLSKMMFDRKTLSTSLLGGVNETEELLKFCSKNNIKADVKIIPIEDVNKAFKSIGKSEPDFRYVIDMTTIKNKKEEKGLLRILGL